MMIQAFDYIAPESLNEVLMQMKGSASQLLVGDQAYVSLLKKDKSTQGGLLVSLKNLPEFSDIEVGGDFLSLGVTTTFADLKKHESLSTFTALKDALATVRDPHLLNNSTIGGALYHGQIQHSPIAGALLALNAQLDLVGEGTSRTVSMDEFFSRGDAAVLSPGELIRSVKIPLFTDSITAYHEIKVPDGKRSVCGLASSMSVTDSRVNSIRLVLTNCVKVPVRMTQTESQLLNKVIDSKQVSEVLVTIGNESITIADDLQIQPDYLYHLIKVLLKRVLLQT
jgi:carbon-monoxide dehydrogenase medium subunit